MPWTEQLAVAERAALAAGELIRMRYGRRLKVRSKDLPSNLVTDVDTASEDLIRARIAERFPNDAVLGEEEGQSRGARTSRWIVDPLDGTTNFAHGYPFFSVSIAYEEEGAVVVGVVYDPLRDELFVGARGSGARCNGGAIHVSARSDLRQALVVTGFPPLGDKPPDLSELREIMTHAQAVRRDGSAALDLCYVAAGRFDAFWERGLHAWDVAAGALIVREAGGRVTNYEGGDDVLDARTLVASNSALHDAVLGALHRP